MQVRILPSARERLLGIWQYTFDLWGESQADDYIAGLVAAAHALPAKRHLWRPVRDPRFTGIYLFRYHHHYLFFKLLEEGAAIGILAVLHENMDLPNRLTDDLEP